MNILYFTPNFPPQSEAAATRAYWFVKTLRESGHDVEVLTGQTTKSRLASNKDHPFKRLLWENIIGIELFLKMLLVQKKSLSFRLLLIFQYFGQLGGVMYLAKNTF